MPQPNKRKALNIFPSLKDGDFHQRKFSLHRLLNSRLHDRSFSLLWRRAKREGETSKNHIKLNITFNPKKQERRAFLPGLNARVSSASVT